jgi:hypothetical protein
MTKDSHGIPTASLNELSLFACQTQLAKKRQIIARRKNPKGFVVNHYRYAYDAILGCVTADGFIWENVQKAYDDFLAADRVGDFWQRVRKDNIRVVRKFLAIAERASPPQGIQICGGKLQYLKWNGVQISIRPDIVTLCKKQGIFAFTKLRLAREKFTWEASQYALIALERFGRSIEGDLNLKFSIERSKLADCADQIVFEGHKINDRKRAALEHALEAYKKIWPTVSAELRTGQDSA